MIPKRPITDRVVSTLDTILLLAATIIAPVSIGFGLWIVYCAITPASGSIP